MEVINCQLFRFVLFLHPRIMDNSSGYLPDKKTVTLRAAADHRKMHLPLGGAYHTEELCVRDAHPASCFRSRSVSISRKAAKRAAQQTHTERIPRAALRFPPIPAPIPKIAMIA